MDKLKDAESALSNIEKLDGQIATFIKMNQMPEHGPVSVAMDAVAMTHDRSYLPGKNVDYSFVIYSQPLDRNDRCLPLHVVMGDSRQATPDLRKVVDEVCARLSQRGLVVKYLCTHGNPGYSEYHKKIFTE
jgi:hypothetical protein